MSCDVCPFCGKTYKRLKSHLPHCKAAPSSKTPPARNGVTANQTSSSQVASTESAAGGGKAKQSLPVAAKPQSKNSKKVSQLSPASPPSLTPAAQSQSGNPSSSSQSLSLSSASSSSTKKKKQKLSDQIKAATASSSTSTPLLSTQSPHVSPTSSKPRKKSVRALIEDAKSNHVSVGLPEGARSVSERLADPGSSRTTTQTETKSNPDKDNVDSIFLSTDIKPNGASEVKVSQTRKAAQSTSAASVGLDSKVNENRDNFLAKIKRETDDLSVNHLITKAGSGHQARITLQDVKATLGRVNKSRQSRNSSILSQFECSGSGSGIRSGAGLSLFSLPAGNQGDQFPSVSSRPSELHLVQTNRSKQQFPARLLPGHLSSQVSQATPPPPHAANMNEALHTIWPILSHLCSYHPLPVGPHTLPEKAEPQRADDELTKANPGSRKQNTGDRGSKGSLAQQRLGQVRLKELPEWLAGRTPRHPRDLVEMLHKGWQRYYRRYIDVKKGGVGGLSMLLAGYCVLSYIWSYPHLKQDRWRKHH